MTTFKIGILCIFCTRLWQRQPRKVYSDCTRSCDTHTTQNSAQYVVLACYSPIGRGCIIRSGTTRHNCIRSEDMSASSSPHLCDLASLPLLPLGHSVVFSTSFGLTLYLDFLTYACLVSLLFYLLLPLGWQHNISQHPTWTFSRVLACYQFYLFLKSRHDKCTKLTEPLYFLIGWHTLNNMCTRAYITL